MTTAVQDALLERLAEEGRDGEAMVWMVLAAAESVEALDEVIADGTTRPLPRPRAVGTSGGDVARTYLSSVEIRGFRGAGREARLSVKPGRGVTLVVGRNGSGKSSFAEAVEVAFTGTSERWKRKGSKEWTKGWRNVHVAEQPRLVVRLAQEGQPGARIERTWADPETLASGQSRYVGHDGRVEALDDSHWTSALHDYRPFLSYSELGDMLEDGPGRIYQALLAGLGLDGVELARQRLADAINLRTKLGKESRRDGRALADQAKADAEAHPDDARFAKAAALLRAKDHDLDALAALAGDVTGGDDSRHLVAIAHDAPPFSIDDITTAVAQLTSAADALARVRADASGRADDLARLLSLALECATRQPFERCPVCGAAQPLDEAWRTTATAAVEDARARAADAQQATVALATARRRLGQLVGDLPDGLTRGASAGWAPAVDLDVRWRTWRDSLPDDDAARATSVTAHAQSMLDAYAVLQAEAAGELQRRHDVWRPLGEALSTWVVAARQAARGKSAIPVLEDARDWVAGEIGRRRDARFAPIKADAIAFWNVIGRHSNVALQDIELTGQGKQQRVTLKVQVDGTDAPALGVMSQGELNAMTLSLFLPRVMLPQSPFGFVIVDDPVQAMDTARVDGLAQVLARVGETRQVIVFTHDDRLATAFRLQGLPYHPLRVTRQHGSAITVDHAEPGPAEQHLRDATAVAKAEGVPEHLAAHVVPVFCRLSLESTLAETLRRHWLMAGVGHADVDESLADTNVWRLLSLLFFGTDQRRQDVAARLAKLSMTDAAAVVHDCQTGAHARFDGSALELIKRTRKLGELLRKATVAPRVVR